MINAPFIPEQDVLNQCLVVALPDPLTIYQDSPTPRSLAEMDSLLLLILGAAVQCSQKEHVIGSIKNLPTDLQHEFVEKIQEVSEHASSTFRGHRFHSLLSYANMFRHLSCWYADRYRMTNLGDDSQEKKLG